jgi:hypothetical protein
MKLSDQLKALRAENATLKDLLETQYRLTDEARRESEKADDEALELKVELAKLRLFGARSDLTIRRTESPSSPNGRAQQ